LLNRTHRERKESYTASLESEVVQLRANEARLSQEAKTLYSEVTFLKILLAENGIAIPERPEVTHGGERGGNIEKEKTIALTIGQENKRKNRRKQIYVQQMPREPSSKCIAVKLQLHLVMMSSLMELAQPARRNSLLRHCLALRDQGTPLVLFLTVPRYVWVASTQKLLGWTLS
jgi:hypothetical protein